MQKLLRVELSLDLVGLVIVGFFGFLFRQDHAGRDGGVGGRVNQQQASSDRVVPIGIEIERAAGFNLHYPDLVEMKSGCRFLVKSVDVQAIANHLYLGLDGPRRMLQQVALLQLQREFIEPHQGRCCVVADPGRPGGVNEVAPADINFVFQGK